MFDIGPGEFIALAVVALIVLGPEKLPRYAADAARMLRQLRRMANDARSRGHARELGPELSDLSLSDLDPRTACVRKHLLDPIDLDDLDEPDGTRAQRPGAAPRAGPAVRRRRPPAAVRPGRDLRAADAA